MFKTAFLSWNRPPQLPSLHAFAGCLYVWTAENTFCPQRPDVISSKTPSFSINIRLRHASHYHTPLSLIRCHCFSFYHIIINIDEASFDYHGSIMLRVNGRCNFIPINYNIIFYFFFILQFHRIVLAPGIPANGE